MLKTLGECADRIEAGELFFRENRLTAIAGQLRKGEFHILTLSTLRREAERLLEATRSIDRIIAAEQGREVRDASA